MSKYQKYRARLKDEFLLVGEGSGCSLPADARKTEFSDSGTTESIHFGDATVFLGWYMGILATEHFLLRKGLMDSPDQTLNISETEKELYFALKALKRLMKKAPSAFDTPCPDSSSQQNASEAEGFFIRDDVKSNLKQAFGADELESDYSALNPFQKEESQDQLIHLLLGLALVKKFIPENVHVQGKSLLKLAQKSAVKICTWPSQTKWIIRNPFCGNKKVARGDFAVFFSYPIALPCHDIFDSETDLLATVRRFYKFLWRRVLKHRLPFIYNPTNRHLALTLACTTSSWGENSLKHIFRLSKKHDWPLYPLLHTALHHEASMQSGASADSDSSITELLLRAESMLNEAPEEGPSYEQSPPGWKASHRFLAGTSSQNLGYDPHQGMRFCGADFMLLHNLCQIVKAL